MKEVRAVKIRLADRTKEDFLADISLCFPVLDETLIEKFYDQVSPMYREIMLDTLTGELLMGLTYNAGWLVMSYYLRNIPTPETLGDAYQGQPKVVAEEEEDEFASETKPFKLDEAMLDRIIDKISLDGVDSLSQREMDFLNRASKHLKGNK